jgi:hypothetical protein
MRILLMITVAASLAGCGPVQTRRNTAAAERQISAGGEPGTTVKPTRQDAPATYPSHP